MPSSFIEENARELKRLRALVNRLTREELRTKVDERWTVSTVLAHLAFWDNRALLLVNQWKNTGVSLIPIDADQVNERMFPLWSVIGPSIAASMAVSTAEAVDRALETASPELIAEIEALEGRFKLARWEHRREHIDQIEQALAGKSP
jgi:hypothetical protein